ncbi:DUF2599 domain-containing protein [Gordonia sp. SID5947]|uniref:DUF2599 domain-containing protein n=1 Tax=Gordonia sp. SID5947 TaxID=2690315 RepID=UPI00136B52F6|nr:DUF2599 domain-containing protein [Gordonia sp. SID5947]MYR08471.1 DUF2599 domain-containing protein [Gordonia sp. SID5947]
MDVDLNRVAGALGCVAAGVIVVAGCGSSGDVAVSSVSPTPSSSEVTSATAAPVATPVLRPPYVDHVDWVQTDVGASLQIHPTPSGRRTDDQRGADVAWSEVLAMEPDADTPGMRAQFDCHWDFARAVEPDKPSWNIEPSRPVVTDQVMIETRCNPGAPEE